MQVTLHVPEEILGRGPMQKWCSCLILSNKKSFCLWPKLHETMEISVVILQTGYNLRFSIFLDNLKLHDWNGDLAPLVTEGYAMWSKDSLHYLQTTISALWGWGDKSSFDTDGFHGGPVNSPTVLCYFSSPWILFGLNIWKLAESPHQFPNLSVRATNGMKN